MKGLNTLTICNGLIYKPYGLTMDDFNACAESAEYEACTFSLSGKKIVYRKAKLTPKKVGHFVTIWQRLNGITTPYNDLDLFDYFIIAISDNDKLLGQFIFSKDVLIQHGIITTAQKAGKRGMRVYAPWVITNNKTAQKTQAWQSRYFVDFKQAPNAIFSAMVELMDVTNK